MYLRPAAAAFAVLWLGVAASALSSALDTRVLGDVPTLVPIGMFIFGFLLVLGGFYPEAIKARRLLEKGLGLASA